MRSLLQILFCMLLILYASAGVKAEGTPSFTDREEAVQYVREQMKQRIQQVPLFVSKQVFEELNFVQAEVMTEIVAHTGNPDEGDTLAFASGHQSWQVTQQSEDVFLINFTFSYHDNARQETEARKAIAALAEELELTNTALSQLEKVRRIYNWVTYSVYYDDDNQYNDEHPAKWTAYSAAVEKLSVCQGISTLIYRLMLTAGIDCRVVASNEMQHSWNIVAFNGLYYAMDATWDLGRHYGEQYFMRGSADFYHENRDDNFREADFRQAYPMSRYRLNLQTLDQTLPVLGYLQCGKKRTLDDGRLLDLCGDGRNKVLVFFNYDCGITPSLLQGIESETWNNVDFYFIENSGSIQEAEAHIRSELSFGTKAVFLSVEHENYTWKAEMEYEAGIKDCWTHSPTVFLVNGQNQVLHAYHGYETGLYTLIHAYFSDEASYTTGVSPDGSSHSWADARILARPTAISPGTEFRVCSHCGTIEINRLDLNRPTVSGQCGDQVFWAFDKASGALSISGSGPMWNNSTYDGILGGKRIGWVCKNPWSRIDGIYETPGYIAVRDYIEANDVKSIQIEAGIDTIGNSMFHFFGKVTQMEFPEGVTSLGEESSGLPVFDGMESLASVVFPSTLKRIYEWEFDTNPALKTVVFKGDAILIWSLVNRQSDSVVTIYYPDDNPTWTEEVIGYYQYGGCVLVPLSQTGTVETKITKQPKDVRVPTGGTASFTVEAEGEGLKYQWQLSKDAGKTWTNSGAAGNKTFNLKVTVMAGYNNLRYRCLITDANGKKLTSKAAVLKVTPVITTHPVEKSGKIGDTVKFTVAASGAGLKKQWQYSKDAGKTWTNSGAAGNKTFTLSFRVTAGFNKLLYRCMITDANGMVLYSKPAALTVTAELKANPAGAVSAKVGDKVVLSVTAAGAGLKKQWQYSGDGGKSWKNSGAEGSKTFDLVLKVSAGFNKLQYRCVITDANGKKLISKACTLTVVSMLKAHPEARTSAVGDTARFTVKATGAGLKYQWYYSNDSGKTWIMSRATGSKRDTLLVEVKKSFNGLMYRCVITDANGRVLTTKAAKLTVK